MTADAIRRLPKVQLHCHLEGTLRAETFVALARHYGVDIGARATARNPYAFDRFGEFLLLFAEVCKTLRQPDDFARLAHEYAQDALAQGVVYGEIFISPSVWTYFHRDLDVRATVKAIHEALDATAGPRGAEFKLICDLTRNFGPERAFETARQAADLQDLGVIGIGLGGDEVNYPPALFADAYAFARAQGLHTVAHAGEAAGAASVREAIDVLQIERVGHGVRAIEDPELVDELAQRKIALEICPTSNRLTGAVNHLGLHPLAELDARGVLCTIDADDPALFGTALCDEYEAAARLAGDDALLRFARNAIDASFAPAERKIALRERFDSALASLGMAAPRSVEA